KARKLRSPPVWARARPTGAMASSKGSARLTPAPRSRVRRESVKRDIDEPPSGGVLPVTELVVRDDAEHEVAEASGGGEAGERAVHRTRVFSRPGLGFATVREQEHALGEAGLHVGRGARALAELRRGAELGVFEARHRRRDPERARVDLGVVEPGGVPMGQPYADRIDERMATSACRIFVAFGEDLEVREPDEAIAERLEQ